MTDGNWEFEFFDGERYNEALGRPHPVREFVSIHTFDEHPGIATLLLSRPPTNALTRQLCREIISRRRRTRRARRRRGGDRVRRTRDLLRRRRRARAADARTPRRRQAPPQVGRDAVDALAAIPKPTVAAITGYALGSGLTLALAADWRVAGDNVKVGATGDPRRAVPAGRRRPGWRARSARARPRTWCSAAGSSTPRRRWRWA